MPHKHRLLFCALLLLTIPPSRAAAQGVSFYARRDYLAGYGPRVLAVADFNHDGNPDLATANSGGDGFSVVLGRSNGNFSPPATYAVGAAVNSIAIADFNGDGILDVALNGTTTGVCCISIFYGNGDGTFRAGPIIDLSAAECAQSVTAADVNKDGKADLIVPCVSDLEILLGNGDGTFQPPIGVGIANSFLAFTGDFNQDGNLDLAAFTGLYPNPSSVVILLGAGDGAFHTTATYPLTSTGNWLATGDVNGDGNLDLAVTTLDSLSLMLGNGDGTFRPLVNLGTEVHNSVAIGDVNGDGVGDIVVAGGAQYHAEAQVLISKGNGTFRAPVSLTVDLGPDSIVLADFNHDGKLDIATGDNTAGVSILLNAGNGGFVHSTAFPASQDAFQIAAGDFNGDGRPDLVTTDHKSPSNDIAVVLNQGHGAFGPPTFITLPGESSAVVTGDFNGDGKLDIAVGTFGSYAVSIVLGNGDGTFQPPANLSLPGSGDQLATGDFNHDGKLDLSVGTEHGIMVLIGKGDGTFQPPLIYAPPHCCTEVILTADFNGDGNLDIVAFSHVDNASIYVFLGNGDGTFQAPLSFQIGLTMFSAAAADFNGDGKPDLALIAGDGGYNTMQMMVFLGNGDGTFQAPVTYYAGFSASLALAADFNHDGKIDLAVSNRSDSNVGVLLGNGDGTFQPVEFFGAAGQASGLVAADVNGDGKLDIAACCRTFGICVLLNNSQ